MVKIDLSKIILSAGVVTFGNRAENRCYVYLLHLQIGSGYLQIHTHFSAEAMSF